GDGIRGFHVTGVQTCALPICAATDLFGRWSAWSSTTHTSVSDVPGKPQILKESFNLSPAGNRVIPASLEVDIAWDWEDRSPGQRSEERRVGKGGRAGCGSSGA